MKVGCFKHWMWCLALAGAMGCSGSGGDEGPGKEPETETPAEPEPEKKLINISVSMKELANGIRAGSGMVGEVARDALAARRNEASARREGVVAGEGERQAVGGEAEGTERASRATEVGFEAGDAIGLYVVNYVGGAPTELKNSGNHADNAAFTYEAGTWKPETEIYWKDEETPADFYAYYPRVTVTDVTKVAHEVAADQSTAEAYAASDFLWGKTEGVTPSESAVRITVHHAVSCIQVKVVPGNGFTEESLAAAEMAVRLNHVMTEAAIDLRTGTAMAQGARTTMTLGREGEVFRALVVPQTVEECALVDVEIDGRTYTLTNGITFETNKRLTCTVEVKKTSEGVNVDIGNWEEDDIDYGGVAE